MAKKRQRSSQTSKGERRPQDPRWSKLQRLEYTGSLLEGKNKREAWARGKRVMLTIANPNTNETNKPFVRVNASEVWGDWRGKKAPK